MVNYTKDELYVALEFLDYTARHPEAEPALRRTLLIVREEVRRKEEECAAMLYALHGIELRFEHASGNTHDSTMWKEIPFDETRTLYDWLFEHVRGVLKKVGVKREGQ